MSYTVRFTVTVADTISKFHPESKKHLRLAVKDISAEPYSGKDLQEELYGFMSYRFKRYRIIYKFDETDKVITVYTIGHRRDIYELFSELVSGRSGIKS